MTISKVGQMQTNDHLINNYIDEDMNDNET